MHYTTEIVGYRVFHVDINEYIHTTKDGKFNFTNMSEPEPVGRGDAFRRLAAYVDEHPEVDHDCFDIVPVFREVRPTESAASELTDMLKALCQRHGITLGLTDDQIRAQLERELKELTGAK